MSIITRGRDEARKRILRITRCPPWLLLVIISGFGSVHRVAFISLPGNYLHHGPIFPT